MVSFLPSTQRHMMVWTNQHVRDQTQGDTHKWASAHSEYGIDAGSSVRVEFYIVELGWLGSNQCCMG